MGPKKGKCMLNKLYKMGWLCYVSKDCLSPCYIKCGLWISYSLCISITWEVVRFGASQAPRQTYKIRICILRSLNGSYDVKIWEIMMSHAKQFNESQEKLPLKRWKKLQNNKELMWPIHSCRTIIKVSNFNIRNFLLRLNSSCLTSCDMYFDWRKMETISWLNEKC